VGSGRFEQHVAAAGLGGGPGELIGARRNRLVGTVEHGRRELARRAVEEGAEVGSGEGWPFRRRVRGLVFVPGLVVVLVLAAAPALALVPPLWCRMDTAAAMGAPVQRRLRIRRRGRRDRAVVALVPTEVHGIRDGEQARLVRQAAAADP